eukprot:TRINITY_DN9811_c0_g1_i1.p1 TRINITY_DN9811_c0_g1~~TRINITY_DN9811_c0_g1_i1.p1  ORF type:complete len:190 (-),score=8.14 TRINITY_DN9811_c0_g1_i1:55-624(-)
MRHLRHSVLCRSIDPCVRSEMRMESTKNVRRSFRDEQLSQKRNVEPLLRDRIVQLISELTRDDQSTLKAITTCRIRLATEDAFLREKLIDHFIEVNGVLKIIHMMLNTSHIEIHIEGGWTLANLLSGRQDQGHLVMSLGADVVLLLLLTSPVSTDLCETLLWGLGNISGCCNNCRDSLLNSMGVLKVKF